MRQPRRPKACAPSNPPFDVCFSPHICQIQYLYDGAQTEVDFAEAAAAVVAGQGHEGKTYELAGDEAFTMSDLAAEVSRQTGKTIVYKDMPEADYVAALASFGLPQPVAQVIARYDVDTRQGALFDKSHQLSALIGRPTTPLSVAVAEALKQQRRHRLRIENAGLMTNLRIRSRFQD